MLFELLHGHSTLLKSYIGKSDLTLRYYLLGNGTHKIRERPHSHSLPLQQSTALPKGLEIM